jgi:hypothetical protein
MATKKSVKKSMSTRKYSPAAGKSVEREMKAMKQGKLKSGSGQKVTNPKQAIAIGLSEARKAGKKAPPPRRVSLSSHFKPFGGEPLPSYLLSEPEDAGAAAGAAEALEADADDESLLAAAAATDGTSDEEPVPPLLPSPDAGGLWLP